MSKAARQRSARDRLAEERKRQAQREARRRALLISLSGLAVLAIVVGITVYVTTKKEQRTQKATAYTGQLAPVSREADGSIVMANSGVTTPLLEVFEDFQCPICKEFETSAGDTLNQLVADNKIKLVYHPVAFLDRASTTQYSTRSAASAACAADAGKLAPYIAELYREQRPEGSAGLSNDELVAAATKAGITDPAFATCLKDGKYTDWVSHVTDQAVERGVTGTPTVYVNGKQVQASAQAVQAAVTAASAKS
jgi:protein-disulfide isomerase